MPPARPTLLSSLGHPGLRDVRSCPPLSRLRRCWSGPARSRSPHPAKVISSTISARIQRNNRNVDISIPRRPRIQERREECDVSRVPGETNLRDVEGCRAGRGANNGVTILDHNSLLCRRDEAMARTPWSSFVSARSWEHIVLYTRRVVELTVRTPWSSFVSHVAVSTPGRRQFGPLLKPAKQARHSTPSKNFTFWSVEDASE